MTMSTSLTGGEIIIVVTGLVVVALVMAASILARWDEPAVRRIRVPHRHGRVIPLPPWWVRRWWRYQMHRLEKPKPSATKSGPDSRRPVRRPS